MRQIEQHDILSSTRDAKDLAELIAERPDLPVLAMVDAEICCGDDYGCYLGKISTATIDKFVMDDGGRMYFISDEDVECTLENVLTCGEYDNLPDDDRARREFFDELPWTEAILVYTTIADMKDGGDLG